MSDDTAGLIARVEKLERDLKLASEAGAELARALRNTIGYINTYFLSVEVAPEETEKLSAETARALASFLKAASTSP
jgi:hypothetical protein